MHSAWPAVEYVDVCLVVNEKQYAAVAEQTAIREQGGVDCEQLTPGHLTAGGVQVSLSRRVDSAEAGADPHARRPV